MNKTRAERAAALEVWADTVDPKDLRTADTDSLRLIAEPGGATALAALRCGAYVPERGERVVVAVCGSNCDPSTIVPPSAA